VKTIHNDIYRMVNLRGPRKDLAIDPDENGGEIDIDGPVIRFIRDPNRSRDEIRGNALDSLIEEMSRIEQSVLDSPFYRLAAEIAADRDSPPAIARDSVVSYGDASLAIKDLSGFEPFRRDFANAYNVWLLARLRRSYDRDLEMLEDRLRVGYWMYAVTTDQNGPANAYAGSSFSTKRLLLPRSLRESITAGKNLQLLARLKARQAERSAQPNDLEQEYLAAKRQIDISNGLEERIYTVLTADLTKQEQSFQDEIIRGDNKPGLVQVVVSALFGKPQSQTQITRNVPTIEVLDQALVTEMKQGLAPDASVALDEILADAGSERLVSTTLEALARRKSASITRANELYTDMLIANPYDKYRLPEPTQDDEVIENGAVQALGWGDLIVARETLLDYEAREIAHIENILPNEKKNRDHTRSKTIEETFETETTDEEESERELETTSRHELQVGSEKVIEQDFSIKGGVNTSGRYGLTKVETSLDAGFNRSTRESERATIEIAKEIVAKIVERTLKSVRELRRRTVTVDVVDQNLHEINNIPQNGGTASSISGIYKWVEKVHQIELRHYGTRMMVEFSVPEPALSIVGRIGAIDVDVEKPKLPRFDVSDINESNYLSYAKQYNAIGISPPPDKHIEVGFAWASQPSESDDEDTSEDVLSVLVAIPDRYRPIKGHFSLSAHPSQGNFFQVRIQIGQRQFSRSGDATFRRWFTMDATNLDTAWPRGVPVSMTAHGHFDKTLSLNIVFTCRRREAALRQWQIDTYQAIWAGYEKLLQDYNEALETARIQSGIRNIPEGAPEIVNRRTEREELQKWSIKILRRESIDFDAVVPVGAGDKRHHEVSPSLADQQASRIRFYEEAFEWDNMSYFFYPYFWGRRNAWNIRQSLRHNDFRFETFLRAGSARVIVPVTPGYEAKILYYLANQDLPEIDRIKGPPDLDPTDDPPDSVAESVYDTMWLELLLNKNDELAIGSGFLAVTNGSKSVDIVDSTWEASARDIGRELYIAGGVYEIESIVDSDTILLTTGYQGDSESNAVYATGSVAFGQPWVVNLPTNLVILDENKANVKLR